LKPYLLELQAHHFSTAKSVGPSPDFTKVKSKLEELITAAPPIAAKQGYWAYVAALREEISSKVFYRLFKKRHANADIPSLHVTPDWNNPDTKVGTTDTSSGVVEEARRYFVWRFSARRTTGKQAFISKLSAKPISDVVRNSIEGEITCGGQGVYT
jgi:hypothetical protein